MLNEVYKERFPKATAQMEEKLSHFIQDLEHVSGDLYTLQGKKVYLSVDCRD